jgi:putative exosortase-associated protein (TIGR04073 family)
MLSIPSRLVVLVAGIAVALLAAGTPSAVAADEGVPAPLTKLTRGITNVAIGLPAEIVYHVVGTAHSEENLESAGGYTAGFFSGLLLGIGWGAARIGSGVVDVVTFPVPFDDNRPLLEPDYIL